MLDGTREVEVLDLLVVPGVGRTYPFRIGEDVYDEVHRSLARVFYFQRAGIDLTYTRRRFPELIREGEFLPPGQDGVTRNHMDRIWANAFKWIAEDKRLHGHLGAWTDEDGNGGSADLGLEWQGLFVAGSRTELVFYGALAQFENVVGGRISFGRLVPHGRWDVLYDLSNHHIEGAEEDRDDLLQHRL